MAYDLQEQEQLEAIKAFWAKYGTAILAALTVALLIVAGTRGWAWYQARQGAAAAGLYAELVDAVERRNIEQVKQRSEPILKEYGSTAYGPMAGLMAARGYADAKDVAGAKGALQWVIDNADDPEYQHLARLRLAGLLLDEKAYDAALAAIEPGSVGKPGAEMAGALADRRGDILFAKGDRDAARTAYQEALASLPPSSALRQLVQLKIDAL
jgi:predicted negative regulator of RcsB-dependent stress response